MGMFWGRNGDGVDNFFSGVENIKGGTGAVQTDHQKKKDLQSLTVSP
jgi:hypothetical protein